MVGHRFVESLGASGRRQDFEVTVLGEETRPAYDRVNLSKFFDGGDGATLALASPEKYAEAGIRLVLGDPVASVDRQAKRVQTRAGLGLDYDHLVLATGSSPFVPPIEGRDAPGCFVYRTIEDLEAIGPPRPPPPPAWARSSAAVCWASRRPTPCETWVSRRTWWRSRRV